jgi:hypothetical protein
MHANMVLNSKTTPAHAIPIFSASPTMPDQRKRRDRNSTPPSDSPISLPRYDSAQETEGHPSPSAAPQHAELVQTVPPTSQDALPRAPESPGPRGHMEQAAWRTVVQAQAATSLCFANDPAHPSGDASTSSLPRSYPPVTRSELARIALRAETKDHTKASAVERDALHDQQDRHQDDLDRDDPKCYVLLDLPANRVAHSFSPGKKPEPLYTYQFIQACAVCGHCHPNYTRTSTPYFMIPFIGPGFEILTHHRRPIPPPTNFYHKDIFDLDDWEQNTTIYGHRSQGIFLSPLAVLLVPRAPDWDISFRFMSCEGMREWELRVRAEEVHSTMITVIWICRTSGDIHASLSLDSTDNVDDNTYIGFIGRTPHLEVNHSWFPFPIWPNLQPRFHSLSQ